MRGLKAALLAALLLSVYARTTSGQTPAQSPALNYFTDIRQVDFQSFTYKLEGEKERAPTQLHYGRVTAPDGAESDLMRLTYGDLTGDGVEEAIVLLRCQNTRISRTLDEVFIYTLKDGAPVVLDHFEGGRRGDYFLSVERLKGNFRVEDRFLILDQAIRRTGEEFPTHYYTIKYSWNGLQLQEVERSCLKPLPDRMREVG